MSRQLRFRGDIAFLVLAAVVLVLVLAKATPWAEGNGSSHPSQTPAALAVAHRGTQFQELAALERSQAVSSSPGARPFEQLAATRPITGERTVLPVLGSRFDGATEWLRVRLPGRPNGLTGWIPRAGTKLEYTKWRIVVNLIKREVSVYDAGKRVQSYSAVIGAPATPTPRGQFFVEENVALSRSAVGYPYALALSARSNVLQEFAGGPGQIALHGLDNVGGTPGTAISHGCLRLTTNAISWLANHIEPGVPVTIR
jgi:lipoprotein-anchoring transpeptidase ErfK/SrfK